MTRIAQILSTGSYVPERVVTNAEIDAMLGEATSDWLVANVGIRERRWMAPEQTTSDLIVEASRRALDKAGLSPEQLNLIIVSTDKDFAQLIGDQVRMLDTFRDVSYDAELVRKKWGVPPHQFVDYLALIGDKVDNIPGVPGIGAKGASQLLDQFGTLDNMLAHLDQIQGKNRKCLEENVETARMSQELARINCQVEAPSMRPAS